MKSYPCLVLIILLTLFSGCVTEKKGSASKWNAIFDAAFKENYSRAARLTLKEVESERYLDKSYTVWRWFETRFGSSPDYPRRQRAFGEALVERFKKGSPKEKQLIGAIFGHPNASQMGYEDFKAGALR